jgi:hypothetical protein
VKRPHIVDIALALLLFVVLASFAWAQPQTPINNARFTGTFNGFPSGGTIDLSLVTVTGLPGGGSVTSVSVVTANGISGSVATPNSTPAITLTLGAITPTSVAAVGTVTGSNLSGTNTGDQTSVSGNAGTATQLQTARTINGVSFDGTANITVTAAAGTLTGTTLASGVTASSLLSAAGGSFGTAAFVASSTFEPALGNPSVNGYVLSSTTAGVRSWVAQSGGGGTPGGSDTQVQFNDGGAFGGDAGLTYNKTTDALTVAGAISGSNLSGTNTGDQTNISGNAATATALQTARTISGVSFDGTANISITTAGVNDSTNRRYVTDAQLVVIGNTSGTNTGDQTSVTGNAGTATALQTARNINGVSFNGTADITVTAAAGTLTGTTLNSSVVTSSLTSVGTLTALTVSGAINASSSGVQALDGAAWAESAFTGRGSYMVQSASVNPGLHGLSVSGLPSQVLFTGSAARGTLSSLSPTLVNDGQLILMRSYGGSTWANSARLELYASDTHSETSRPSHIALHTTPTGSTSVTERVRITSAGDVGIGTGTPLAKLHVESGTGTAPATITNAQLRLTQADDVANGIQADSWGSGTGLQLLTRRAGGTRASPSATGVVTLLDVLAYGYDNAGYTTSPSARYQILSPSTWSGTNRETSHRWIGTPSGSTTAATWMTLDGTGLVSTLPILSSTSMLVSNNGEDTSAEFPSTSTRIGGSYDGQFIQTMLSYGSNAAVVQGVAGGTKASPTGTASGVAVAIYGGYGYNTTNGWGGGTGSSSARLSFETTEAHTSTGHGTKMVFGVTANGSTTRAGIMEITSNGTSTLGAQINLTAAHAADDLWQGESIIGLNAGATIAQWEAVYLGGSSTWLLADANGSSTYPARGLAVAAYSSSNAAVVITKGTVRNDAWAWTPGGTIYLSTTAGGLTQTAPSATTEKIQQVGFALTADIAHFDFASGEYLTIP